MSNCYEGVGERTDGMTGKELAARPVRSDAAPSRPDDPRHRPKVSDGAWMWKPAGSYAITDVRCPGDRPRENRNATAGLRAGSLPAGIPDRI